MSSMETLFSGLSFIATIKKYCAAHSWNISDVNERRAILKFRMNSGRQQTLYIIKYDTTLEFSVPTMLMFDSEDDIPHFLSTLLLQRSAERKVGFWCIEKIAEKSVYSVMHNAELSLIDSAYFERVISLLIAEADEFEGIFIRMANAD